MKQAHRFSGPGQPYDGLTTIRRGKVDWNGVARFIPEQLGAPLKWRKPARVFVNSMSDLFHPSLSDEEIAAVFGVMAACPQHTFQVLTKQPKRAAEWFKWVVAECDEHQGCERDTLHHALHSHLPDDARDYKGPRWQETFFEQYSVHAASPGSSGARWPLPNVWLGTSAENQETYNARVPMLVHQCPAAVHFVSAEPLLGPLKLRGTGHIHLDWVIVGGESGTRARPCHLDWITDLVSDCRESGIPCFVKQLGSRPCITEDAWRKMSHGMMPLLSPRSEHAMVKEAGLVQLAITDRAGGDMAEWPEALRVRQFPEVRA